VSIRTLMMIDSLDMTDADRDVIVRNCAQCAEARIVITHGTDTMVETAVALARGVTGKTIVLTGAMIPYAFGSSDGLFNLGSALSFVQTLPAGVYIAMNGQHFAWDRVRKNRQTGVLSLCKSQIPNPKPETWNLGFGHWDLGFAVVPPQLDPRSRRASEAVRTDDDPTRGERRDVGFEDRLRRIGRGGRSIIWLKSQS
jgi:L-asparaginase